MIRFHSVPKVKSTGMGGGLLERKEATLDAALGALKGVDVDAVRDDTCNSLSVKVSAQLLNL